MSKLIFTMKRDWIEEKKKQFGNPIRKMERFVREYEGAKLVKSDYDSCTTELEADIRERFAVDTIAFIQSTFEEKDPLEYIKWGGDIRDVLLPGQDGGNKSGEVKAESTGSVREAEETETDTKQQSRPKREEVVTTEINPQIEPETRREQRKGSTTGELAKQDEETVSTEQDTEVVDEAFKRYIEEACNSIPMKYSTDMAEHFREIGEVKPMLDRMQNKECLWSQNLLMSIDSGFGLSAFLAALAKAYYYDEKIADYSEWVKELVIENDKDNKYAPWKSALDRATEMARYQEKDRKKNILCMDISQWQNEIRSTTVLDNFSESLALISQGFQILFL